MIKISKVKTDVFNSKVKRIIIYALIVAVLLFIILALYIVLKKDKIGPTSVPKAGSTAANFCLNTVQDESVSLDSMKGKAFLLTFVYISKDYENKDSEQSRAQMNFIKSMERQYGTNGMKFLIVDASYLLTGEEDERNDLINYTYDWGLNDIPLLVDKKSEGVASKYAVSRLPTTLLIDGSGVISQRWDGVALTSQLASGIEQFVGEPSYRKNYTPQDGEQEGKSGKYQETYAQSIFKGMDAARQLSENLWLVDGGKDWDSKSQSGARLIAVGLNGELNVKVYAENIDNMEKINIYEGEMNDIPKDDAKELIFNMVGVKPVVKMNIIQGKINKSGYYKIYVSVSERGSKKEVQSGLCVVYVK